MSKFASEKAPKTAPVKSTGRVGRTYEGAVGYERDAKSELFLLAVANMVGEQTFYESAGGRDSRFISLVNQVTNEDPEWVARFVPYLRDEMRMRSASIVMAAEYVRAGGPNGRSVVASAIKRPDEPAEMLGYWHSTHGRNEPKAIKRGIADALGRLYNEKNSLKYDGTGRPWRFGDVIERVHAKAGSEWQGDLYTYLLDTAHGRKDARLGETLAVIQKNRDLWAMDKEARLALLSNPSLAQETFKEAGMTWEDASSWVQGPLSAEFWEAIIPSMGAMALVRNLRNFDQAGISDAAASKVKAVLTDKDAIERSRQLPFRFYTAWREVKSLRWGDTLETALQLSTESVPVLQGRTLILIDVSGSMNYASMGRNAKVDRWEQAAVFGFALASRQEKADVVAFSSSSVGIQFSKGDSVLRGAEALRNCSVFGGGTNTWQAVERHLSGHDRVIIVTDEQAHYGTPPAGMPTLYTFNLAGYKAGHSPSGEAGKYTFGGLSDAAFLMLPLLEAGRSANWPF